MCMGFTFSFCFLLVDLLVLDWAGSASFQPTRSLLWVSAAEVLSCWIAVKNVSGLGLGLNTPTLRVKCPNPNNTDFNVVCSTRYQL